MIITLSTLSLGVPVPRSTQCIRDVQISQISFLVFHRTDTHIQVLSLTLTFLIHNKQIKMGILSHLSHILTLFLRFSLKSFLPPTLIQRSSLHLSVYRFITIFFFLKCGSTTVVLHSVPNSNPRLGTFYLRLQDYGIQTTHLCDSTFV